MSRTKTGTRIGKRRNLLKIQNNETDITLAHSNSLHGYPDPFADDSNNASKKIRHRTCIQKDRS